MCDNCKLTLKGTQSSQIIIRNNYAQEGGAIFIRDTTTTFISGTTFSSLTATSKGGVLVADNPLPGPQGTITFESSTINNVKASSGGLMQGSGGAFYMNSNRVSLLALKKMQISNVQADMHGGVIYVDQMNGEVQIIDGSTIEEFKVSPQQKGSLFHSGNERNIKLTIKNSYIKCTQNYLSTIA